MKAAILAAILYGAPYYPPRSLAPASVPLQAAQCQSVGELVAVEGLDRLGLPATDYNLNGGHGGY